MSDPVIIVDPDPRWPEMYAEEAARLRAAAGEPLVALEHIGSTAVPGLAAKPVVDMLGGVRKLADADALVPVIVAAGWEYHDRHEKELPERRYFVKRPEGVRAYQLHLVVVGSWFWAQQLAFRDHLRTNPAAAARYGALKRELAERFRDDREGYTGAKSAFIAECLPGARVQGG